jgi:hypothetical protein
MMIFDRSVPRSSFHATLTTKMFAVFLKENGTPRASAAETHRKSGAVEQPAVFFP